MLYLETELEVWYDSVKIAAVQKAALENDSDQKVVMI